MAFRKPSGVPFIKKSRLLRGKIPQNKDEHRINEWIRVPQVRLIDEKGNQVGVIATSEALKMARERDLDLMEVAPNSRPPVCKICDYGKFKYEKKKKDQAAKKKQTIVKVKEVQVRPSTDQHDLEIKFQKIRGFLEDGDKAKITMLFRGREITNSKQGFEMMAKLATDMEDVGTMESRPAMEGRKMIMILAPVAKKVKGKKKTEKSGDKKEAS